MVELMIVVGIIGILSSVALPSFKLYKQKVIQSEITTNIGTLFRGASTYYHRVHTIGSGSTAQELQYCLPVPGANSAAIPNPTTSYFVHLLNVMTPPV